MNVLNVVITLLDLTGTNELHLRVESCEPDDEKCFVTHQREPQIDSDAGPAEAKVATLFECLTGARYLRWFNPINYSSHSLTMPFRALRTWNSTRHQFGCHAPVG